VMSVKLPSESDVLLEPILIDREWSGVALTAVAVMSARIDEIRRMVFNVIWTTDLGSSINESQDDDLDANICT